MSEDATEVIIARVADPGEHPCSVCGGVGAAALVIYADLDDPPLALCRSCAANREQVAALVRGIGAPPTVRAVPRAWSRSCDAPPYGRRAAIRCVPTGSEPPMPPVIVIADDDEAIRALLAELLEGEGYRVRQARDGDEALAQLRAERADLFITDQQMPRRTGLQVIASPPGRAQAVLPIILMSALTVPMPPLPLAVFVRKPFDLAHIVTLVQGLLTSSGCE